MQIAITKESINTDRITAWIYGIGLLLFGLHSSVFTVYNSEDEVQFFPPMIGALVLMMVPLLLWMQGKITKASFGPKIILVPLLLITLSIIIRSLITFNSESIAEIGIAIMLFGCYVSARILGKEIFYPLAIFVVIEIISVFIYAIWINPGQPTGGLWSETNYDGATGVIVLGTMLAVFRWQWTLVIGMFIAGWFMASPECVLASFIIGCAFLVRRDWNKWLWIGVASMLVFASLWYFMGDGEYQYRNKAEPAIRDALMIDEYEYKTPKRGTPWKYETVDDGKYMVTWGPGRFPAYERAIKETSPFGHEFDLYRYGSITGTPTVHNVPLVIWDQIGPLAAVCWLFIILYCLWKRWWIYGMIAILSVSLFDHYVWSTLAPYWWCAVGIATAYTFNDRIWKKKSGY